MSVIIKTGQQPTGMRQPDTVSPRPWTKAFRRGWMGKCPNCGQGKIFSAYLKVNDACPVCEENLSLHRADDAPPYITIVLVGHLLMAVLLHLEMAWRIPGVVYIYTLVPLAVILPMLLLPPIKGVVINLQWANRMHGFGGDDDNI